MSVTPSRPHLPLRRSTRPTLWEDKLPDGPEEGEEHLARDYTADVTILGAGITGLSAAIPLAEAGLRVAVLEARSLGGGVSIATTAHATAVVDARYHEIIADHGEEAARVVARASMDAIAQIERWVHEHRILSGFFRRPGYLFSEHEKDLPELEKECLAAARAGLEVELVKDLPLPFATKAGMRVRNQAQFHAGEYLAGLISLARSRGVRFFEATRVTAVEDGETCFVHTEAGPVVRCRAVFAATHAPTVNTVFLQTKLAAYRSYVMAYKGVGIADGLFWDMEDPYHYFSSFVVDGEDYLVVGGEDHKTGQYEKTVSPFDSLRVYSTHRFAANDSAFSWSAQVEESVDGLPYIGLNSASRNVYVATGFGGNGITFGTASAMMISELIKGNVHPWMSVFDATRVKPIAAASNYLRENVDFPIHLLGDRLAPTAHLDGLQPGDGRIVKLGGRRAAVHRDVTGKLHIVSAVCPHMGCLVKFNREENSWDCPCHGSRFDVDGSVIDGPAARSLDRIGDSEDDAAPPSWDNSRRPGRNRSRGAA